MTDREKVLRALGICTQVEPVDECPHGCPYKFEDGCIRGVMKDALELLKAQEPPILAEDFYKPILDEGLNYSPNRWRCGACESRIKYHQKYCGTCGRAVKWDDSD